MPNKTIRRVSYSADAARSKPVAVVNPAEQVKVLGGRVTFDGRGSYSEDGEELTYTWSLVEIPVTSSSAAITPQDDGDTAVLVADALGEYQVGLVVSTSYRTSDQVLATVLIQVNEIPSDLRATPDGSFMFSILSDFWRLVNNREVYPIYWSSLVQLFGAELLRTYQTDYAKSIRDIPELYQRRWLAYEPRLDLGPSQHRVVFGYHQAGTEAFTGSASGLVRGLLLSAREFVLISGSPTSSAIGTSLRIYTTNGSGDGNRGDYTISKMNSDLSGYILSSSTPFPSYEEERTWTGNDLVAVQGSDLLYSADLAFDFTDPAGDGSVRPVAVGDVLRVESGRNSGYFTIRAVGTAGGLSNDRTVQVDATMKDTGSGVRYSVFSPVFGNSQVAQDELTDTVFIPEEDADFAAFSEARISGSCIILSPYEVQVSTRYVREEWTGKRFRITTGLAAGTYVVSGVNESGTGYYVSSPFPEGTGFPRSAKFSFAAKTSEKDRLLILDGATYNIRSVVLDTNQPSVAEGGRGSVWAVIVDEASIPNNQEGLSWRVAATLTSDEHDFEELGVSSGDKLLLEVRRRDLNRGAFIECSIFGAKDNRLSFDIGTAGDLTEGEGELDDDQWIELCRELNLSRVYAHAVDSSLVVEDQAETLRALLNSKKFRASTYNIPLDSESVLPLDGIPFSIRSAFLIRNTKVPVDEYLSSVPRLYEYIDEPNVGETDDGEIILVGKDQTWTTLTRAPVELVENREYTLTGSGEDRFLQFEVGTFDPAYPAPERLWAETSFFDNVEQIEDNFGALVGLPYSAYTEYGTQGTSYYNAVKALMFAFSMGPTIKNVRTAAHILAGLPVTERRGRIIEIDASYEATRGRILVEDLDDQGLATGLVRSYYYPVGDDVYDILAGIATNPRTGMAYALGDVVSSFAVLSNSVQVEDYVRTPGWWRHGSPDVSHPELRKYHTWNVLVDALAVNSQNSDLMWGFLDAIRPIYTQPQLTFLIYLLDTPVVTDRLEMRLTQFHYDDIAFSIEASHQADSYNGSGLATRLFDYGSFATRTLFQGDDLVTTPLANPALITMGLGSDRLMSAGLGEATRATVYSARGGFIEATPYINSAFPDPITTQGESLVHAGDILFILDGLNRGRFLILVVVDDNTLVVRPLSMPPGTVVAEEIQLATGQRFQIQRLDTNPLVTGIAQVDPDGDNPNEVHDDQIDFRWEGATAGDWLVCFDESDPNYGVYKIIQVGVDVAGDLDFGRCIVTPAPPSATESPFRVERDAFNMNPIFTGSGRAEGQKIHVDTDGVVLARVQQGDILRPLTGSDVGVDLYVIDAQEGLLVVDRSLSDSAPTIVSMGLGGMGMVASGYTGQDITFEVIRPYLSEDTADSDDLATRLCPSDDLEITIFRPLALLEPPVLLRRLNAGGVAPVADSEVDLVAAGYGDAEYLEVVSAVGPGLITSGYGHGFPVAAGLGRGLHPYAPGPGVGFYTIDEVEETQVTIEGEFSTVANLRSWGYFYDDMADFQVEGDRVSSLSFDLSDYVKRGDTFSFSAGNFVVMQVQGSEIRLTRDTGVSGPYTGRVYRRSLP